MNIRFKGQTSRHCHIGDVVEQQLHHLIPMTILDLMIIYMACGSPFAVQKLMTRNASGLRSRSAAAFTQIIFWPWTALKMILALLRARSFDLNPKAMFEMDSDLSRIQLSMEKAATRQVDAVSVFEVREVFQRYTGLSLGCEASTSAGTTAELFEITSHPDTELAAACLERKNRLRLLSHREDARSDFIKLILRINGENIPSEKLSNLALETAAIVKDVDGVRALRSALGISNNYIEFTNNDDVIVDLWNPAHQKQ